MVAAKLWRESTRAASITAATPEPSSSAPGASEVAFSGSETRESRCPEMITTRPGSPVPRWIASTSITSVGVGTRSPWTTWEGVRMSRQPPQPRPISAKRAATQRRAAPMPRVSDFVSDKVCRVPKPTRRAIVAWSSSARTSVAI